MSTASLGGWSDQAFPRDRGQLVVVLAGLGMAALAGPLTVFVPDLAIVLVAAIAVVALVALHPPVGAFLLLAATPLIAGIDRDTLMPLLRPSEAVVAVVLGGLAARGLFEVARGAPLRVRLTRVDSALIAFALAGSVLPLLWLLARGDALTRDDVLYALQVWKYVAIFFIVRVCIRRESDVRLCLWISLGAGCIVGGLAILQSLSLFGVPGLLASLYAAGQDASGFDIARGSSTLASSLAVADVMIYSTAIAAAWAVHGGRSRGPLLAIGALCLFGTVASGQYSGFLAIPIAVLALGLISGRLGQFALWSVCGLPLAAAAMWPVINTRLSGFDSNAGVPSSWVGRWENLTDFFWPELANFNWVLGVQPSARLPAPESWREWIWIESGHTWLLWSGGVPFVIAFFVFVWFALRTTGTVARHRTDGIGVAAAAAFTSLCVMSLLMILDPHITLRGSADLLFSLIALSMVSLHASAPRPLQPASPGGSP